jgi:hypothetical protein
LLTDSIGENAEGGTRRIVALALAPSEFGQRRDSTHPCEEVSVAKTGLLIENAHILFEGHFWRQDNMAMLY